MPDGLPPNVRLCAVDPAMRCLCPALHAPHAHYPCANCAERRQHARGCASKPYAGGPEPRPCNCQPLTTCGPCPRKAVL